MSPLFAHYSIIIHSLHDIPFILTKSLSLLYLKILAAISFTTKKSFHLKHHLQKKIIPHMNARIWSDILYLCFESHTPHVIHLFSKNASKQKKNHFYKIAFFLPFLLLLGYKYILLYSSSNCLLRIFSSILSLFSKLFLYSTALLKKFNYCPASA